MDAPERIWAWEYKGYTPWGPIKPNLDVVTYGAEYIRADLAAPDLAELAELVESAKAFRGPVLDDARKMVRAVDRLRAALAKLDCGNG